ncbi:MAG: T9SS type A sorting domain-containing protein [Ignavibacteriae bacterium]|nr:T9SS type A sorting domain-containing protein [Ignavibacteriota bacterium]
MKKLFSTFAFILFFVLQFTFKVDDCSAQWTQVSYNLLGKSISSLAVSGDTIFAGTDHWNGSSYSGIYVSTNNGSNWIQSSLNNVRIYSIIVSGNNIYAATGDFLYLSTNRGGNWTNISAGLNYIRSVAILGNTIYAGSAYNNNGVYLSTNNGVNWVQTVLYKPVYSITVSGSNIIAGTDSYGIYYSTNNGISWSQSSFNNGMVRSFLVSGSNVYAGMTQPPNNGVFVSTNNGLTWTQVFSGTSIYSLTLSGSSIYAGSNNGTYISTNNGTNWSLTALTKYTPALSTLGSVVFAGTQNGYYTTTNNGQAWDSPPPSTIGAILKSGNNLYGGTNDGVFYSTDGGLRWTLKNLIQNTISFLINGSYVFAGTAGAGVYYTTNDGANWTQTSLNNQAVNSLVIKGTNILAATSSGVYYTTNNGTNWTQSTLTGINAKALYVLDSIVYAGTVFSGVYKSTDNGMSWTQTPLIYIDVNSFTSEGGKLYAGTSGSGVYYTTNNGANWTQTSFNTNTIISFSKYGSSIFAGTSGSGVYLTKDGGLNWTQVNDGMGNQGVGALCTYGNYIIAGTGGNGFWRRYILEFAPIRGDANLDSTVNVLDVTSDVNYILGNPPVPFSVLAADVNTDLVINVLDVVGTVNIILHPGNKMFAHNKEQNDNSGSASLYIQNNNLKLQNTIPVAGIQYKLSGAGAQNVVFTPSSELTNYQVAAGSASENSKTFVVFTMSDTSLNSGIHTLGTFTGLNNGITINEIFIADGNGNGILTSNEETGNTEIPKDYTLNQNYPNPFNSTSKLKFAIANLGYTKIVIYDVMGRELQTLVNKTLKPGKYDISIDGSNLSSGVYFYKLTSGSYSATKKMIVLK